MTRIAIHIGVLFGAVLFLAGCSHFEKEWRGADAARPTGGLPRKWEGRWASTKHEGMGGRLRCLFTRIDQAHHQAWFRANWLTFASDYRVVLTTRETPNGLQLRGEQVLHGFGGGLYRYRGTITREHFGATYDSQYDRGRFDLRPVLSDSSMPQLTTRSPIQ